MRATLDRDEERRDDRFDHFLVLQELHKWNRYLIKLDGPP